MAMKRVRLVVAYDGTDYCGWQIQENGVTVEKVLTDALRELLGEDVELIGASRTDSGVHALGNVAVFDTETPIPPEKIAHAVNRYLPEDVRVRNSDEVSPEFHPRHCDSVKTYRYSIVNTEIPVPTMRRYYHHIYGALNVTAMREAAERFVGTHDFSAFCSAGSQVKSKVRTIYEVSVTEELPDFGTERHTSDHYVSDRYAADCHDSGCRASDRVIRIFVRGNGFLYNMVRIIAGTLIEVGQGRRTPESVAEALRSGRRADAGPTAPAAGLMLMKIEYAEKAEDRDG